MATLQMTLVPRPQHLVVSGRGPARSTEIEEVHTDAVVAQGFNVDISDTSVRLSYSDAAGGRYGRELLRQMRQQIEDYWPAVTIRDWPDYAVRGYMLDISRGRVPTRETLERIVSLLDLLRINQFQLYTEHTFAYADHEAVWRDASPMTPADIAWLDQLCRGAGIELVANQNCFGHMEHWLSHGRYRQRAEMPDGFSIFGAHRPAMTLAPTEDNTAFVLGLLEELLPNFASTRVNIGCDETWELGQGASSAECERRGKGRVYLDYLNSVLEPLLDRGYQPQFWGDIIAHDPQLVPELPRGAIAITWSYEAPWTPQWCETLHESYPQRFSTEQLSQLQQGFAPMAEPFERANYPFWVAPGTSGWTSLVGRIDNAIANLYDTAKVGLSSGATGLLIADWGDRGHLQPPSVSFPPLVYGAAVAWSLEANADLLLSNVLDRFVFEDHSNSLGSALDVLGRVWGRTGQVAFNCSPLQAALGEGRFVVAGEAKPDQLRSIIGDIDTAIDTISMATLECSDAEVVKRELVAAARLAKHGALRLLRSVGGDAGDDPSLGNDLSEAIALHKQAWALRSRPGGIQRGLSPLEATLAAYER